MAVLSLKSGYTPAAKANHPVRKGLAEGRIVSCKLSTGSDTVAFLCGAVTLVGETAGAPTVDMAASGETVYGFIIGLTKKDFSWSDYKYGQWIADGTWVEIFIPKDGAEFLVVVGDDASATNITYGAGLIVNTQSTDDSVDGTLITQTTAEAGDRLIALEAVTITDGDAGYIWARVTSGVI
jgi:hypothetical protein